MKKVLWFIAMISISSLTIAQDAPAAEENTDGWKKGGIFTLNFSQVALQNWAAGGQNSFSGVGFFNAYANYSKGKMTWDNTLNLGYGMMKQDEAEWFKSDDKIEFSSKYGQQASEHWYYSALVDFKSQFAHGYANAGDDRDDYISTFFAPAYSNIALGMDYKPNDDFTVFISPLTGKLTIVADTALSNAGAYGIDAGDKLRTEFGAYIKIAYKAEIMENITFQTKLDLFSNYLNKPQNIDVNWDNLLTLKVNEYINASFMFNLIYDDDIKFDVDENNDGVAERQIAKVQLKEMFGVGLSYKF